MFEREPIVSRALLWIGLSLGVAVPAGAATLFLTTEASPPYNMAVDNHIVGIGTDKVVMLMARTNTTYQLQLLPWARAYDTALKQADACVFSTTRTAERETLFRWVGPIAHSDWVLYGRADTTIHPKTLEDVRPYRIGTYNADVRDVYLRTKGFKVDTAMDDIGNPRKLLAGRIDLWASGRYEGRSLIMQNGWTQQIVPVLTFNQAALYLACNKGVPEVLIDRLNRELAAMGEDGSADEIERKYADWPAK